MQTHHHTQVVPASEWWITHDLNSHPVVQVLTDDGAGPTRVIPRTITYHDPSTCVLTFSAPLTGVALLA